MVYKREGSKYWWYKFTWNGEQVRETTKQTNKRVAEQMESAHRTSLAKGEVGIREKKQVPTLRDFATKHFLPFVASTFPDDERRGTKSKTRAYYEYGVKSLLGFERLANQVLDGITSENIGGYVAHR